MHKQLKYLCILVLILFSLASCSTKQTQEEPSSSADAHVLAPFETAVTFTGTIPCSDCIRVDITLNIRPDSMYQIRKTYQTNEGSAKVESQVGKWLYLPKDNLLILGKQEGLLKTYFIENKEILKFVEWEGTDSASQIQYELIRSDELDPFYDTVKLSGKFVIESGAGSLMECSTERSFRIRSGNDYSTLLQYYMNTPHSRGQPLLTSVFAKFVMGEDGKSELIIEKFHKLIPERDCKGKKIKSSLTGTFWRLIEVDGLEVTKSDYVRVPYLRLNSDRSFEAFGGCNQITGSYLVKGDLFKLNRTPSIRLACSLGLEVENKFIEALNSSSTFQLDGEILEIRDQNDRIRARLKGGL